MQPNEANGNSGRGPVLLVLAVVLILLIPLGYSVVGGILPQDPASLELFLEYPDAKHENCIKDTTYMRYHHWELLRGVREEVVRYGKRGEIGLHQCQECHTSRERFCDRCHHATSLTPDCFDCHHYP